VHPTLFFFPPGVLRKSQAVSTIATPAKFKGMVDFVLFFPKEEREVLSREMSKQCSSSYSGFNSFLFDEAF